jgi:nitrite reductase/ring-hydroxylating ferredoxin subunit
MRDRQPEDGSAGPGGFVEVGLLEGLPPGTAMKAAVGGVDLSVVNVGGRIVAITDLCLRCGGSLSAGRSFGTQLSCAHCGWRYDLSGGCVVGLPSLQFETHEVRIDHGRIFVADPAPPAR